MKSRPTLPFAAFTLIELLVVIGVIAIIAAMVVGMSTGASRAKKDKLVNAYKYKYMTLIDNYQSKLGFYPPDNGYIQSIPYGGPAYEQYTATNPLLYELTGVTNNVNNHTFGFFDGTNNVTSASFNAMYNRGGVANSDPTQPASFFNPRPKLSEYTNYPGSIFKGLILPVDTINFNNSSQIEHLNFWHYDSSSTNRHNTSSYDLWAEYFVGRDKSGTNIVITNGNW